MMVGVNEQGYRVGEHHHNARLSNEIVDKIREMHEDEGIGYRRIAKIMGISRHVIAKICRYERRAQTPERWKKVPDKVRPAETTAGRKASLSTSRSTAGCGMTRSTTLCSRRPGRLGTTSLLTSACRLLMRCRLAMPMARWILALWLGKRTGSLPGHSCWPSGIRASTEISRL